MRKRLMVAVVAGIIASTALTPAAFAHEFNPPDGGIGDTPLNSEQSREQALDNYFGALDASDGAAGNSLFRNPTCAAHNTHPQGNP